MARKAHPTTCHAEKPWQIPRRQWGAILHRTLIYTMAERSSLTAAGCGFYAMMALFPSISALIFLYGLVFDQRTVEPQLRALHEVLPPEAYALIADRIHALVTGGQHALSIGLGLSFAIALWSSASGTKSILGGINVAYGETERRGFVRYQLLTIGLTLAGTVAIAMGIAVLVFLPAALHHFSTSRLTTVLAANAGQLLLVVLVFTTLAVLYRIGPCRRPARWIWIVPGAAIATMLWLFVSWGLSWYVTHVASYSITYGSLGTVIIVMTWFYLSAWAVMLGAELNAQMEWQTVADTTIGPWLPMGERQAKVADTLPDSDPAARQ